MSKLPMDVFSVVVESTPLVSIDLVVRNTQGLILLGKRLNRPAQNFWFVPGGRILKGESMACAFSRIVREELGADKQLTDVTFLGPFEHFYDDNVTGRAFTTHYVVLGYEISIDLELNQLPCEQHGNYRWFTEEALLADPQVHLHSKWYVQKPS